MLTDELENTLQRAMEKAISCKHQFITLEHLLFALLEDKDAQKIFDACNINIPELHREISDFLDNKLGELKNSQDLEPKPTLGFQRVIQRSVIHVQSSGRKEANGSNVLVALYSERESHAVYFLQKQDLKRIDVVNYISHGIGKESEKEDFNDRLDSDENESDHSTQLSNNFLKKYCINLNEKAKNKEIDPVIGRSSEIARTIQILSRRNKNNPIFVGDPGVGKTALAEGLAIEITSKKVPDSLLSTIVFSLDLGALIAGTRYRGDFEERLKKIIDIFEKNEDYVIFIDEIHTLIGAGGTNSGSMDASNLLKPALSRRSLRCIGSTTYAEFRNYFEKDRALCRRFQKVDINEPNSDDTIKILLGLKKHYEDFHAVKFEDDCFDLAVSLSQRFMNDRKLPDKAIDILDEAAAYVKINSNIKKKIVSQKIIESVVSKMANVPEKTISSKDKIKFKNLERDLKTLIFGQDNAIEALSNAIKLSKSGLSNTSKPIGSYLFTGPTGVGKTELTKQLANILGIELIRFDMSEFMERHSISKLIGAPPGYVGYDQGGQLTDAVDKCPYCVVLLDEIEKAHPDLFNILLQIMDYGKLKDHLGKSVNFTNVILILTSNIGAKNLSKEKIGFYSENVGFDNDESIDQYFNPEFKNRLDAIIQFEKLSERNALKVIDKFIIELENKLNEQNLTLSISDKAKKYLFKKGFNSKNGARPLANLINKEIKVPLSDLILDEKLSNDEHVRIDINSTGDKLVISTNKSKIQKSKEVL